MPSDSATCNSTVAIVFALGFLKPVEDEGERERSGDSGELNITEDAVQQSEYIPLGSQQELDLQARSRVVQLSNDCCRYQYFPRYGPGRAGEAGHCPFDDGRGRDLRT